MKRLILLLFCLFVLASSSFAWMTLPVVGGGGGPCPSYYASAILSWDGDHTTSNMTACDSAGDPVPFTLSGATIVSDTGIRLNTTNMLKAIDANDYMSINAMSDNVYLSPDADQTICMVVKRVSNAEASLDSDVEILHAEDVSTSDTVEFQLLADDRYRAYLPGVSGGSCHAYGITSVDNAWQIAAYSWQVYDGDPAENHSVNPGDVTYNDSNDDWPSVWEEDAADVVSASSSDVNDIYIGAYGADPDDADLNYILIEEWAIFSGYEQNCADLMGIND